MKALSELHVGRIGEHLVAADLMMKGYDCFHAAQGMPYDLIADIDGRLVKIQVKTTQDYKSRNTRRNEVPVYLFWIHRHGKGGVKKYEKDVDIFAVVSLKEKLIGYLHQKYMPKTLLVRSDLLRGQYLNEVVSARNAPIVEDIKRGGKTLTQIAIEHNLHVSYVAKLSKKLDGFMRGRYFADLKLEEALSHVERAV